MVKTELAPMLLRTSMLSMLMPLVNASCVTSSLHSSRFLERENETLWGGGRGKWRKKQFAP
jgi:hypothetical protein